MLLFKKTFCTTIIQTTNDTLILCFFKDVSQEGGAGPKLFTTVGQLEKIYIGDILLLLYNHNYVSNNNNNVIYSKLFCNLNGKDA